MLATAFRAADYTVYTASDGIEGLQAIESYLPDLIILDVMMPNMDGYEMASRVRANPQTKFIPILIQSAAKSAVEDLRRGFEVGALGYVTDPADLELLLSRARTLLDFKNYLDQCEEAAFTDHLTGLANRRRFERQLKREVIRSKRTNRPFCLLMLDIDHFKNVNDRYGHNSGDRALRGLGETLQTNIRGIDLAARIGGEEFAIILPETSVDRAAEVAERLRAAVQKMKIPEVGGITASLGLAGFPAHSRDDLQLMEAADAAMYRAKRQGRNRVGQPL